MSFSNLILLTFDTVAGKKKILKQTIILSMCACLIVIKLRINFVLDAPGLCL